MNLICIILRDDVDIKYFLDFVLISKLVDLNKVVILCDMGVGVGFLLIFLLIVFFNI